MVRVFILGSFDMQQVVREENFIFYWRKGKIEDIIKWGKHMLAGLWCATLMR